MLQGSITAALVALVALATWAALCLQRRLFPPRPRAYRCTLALVVADPTPTALPLRRRTQRRCRPDRRVHATLAASRQVNR